MTDEEYENILNDIEEYGNGRSRVRMPSSIEQCKEEYKNTMDIFIKIKIALLNIKNRKEH